jgi:heme/copper-type cytochrome/quinol oxidase subunit 2
MTTRRLERACLAGAARLRRRVVTTAAIVMIFGGSTAFACPMCFGAEETTMIDATRLGILVMLGIVLAVQGAFVAFFLHLRKAAKRNAELELEAEWSELQRSRT